HAAGHRPDGPASRRRDGDRRHPARRRPRHGADGPSAPRRHDRARSRGGDRALQTEAGKRRDMKPTETAQGSRVAIESDMDIVAARTRGRTLALELGFSAPRATLLATAISELARNILPYAGRGEIVLFPVEQLKCAGIGVIARDTGPGIKDIALAMQDGYSTSGRLGLGLPGVRRLTD